MLYVKFLWCNGLQGIYAGLPLCIHNNTWKTRKLHNNSSNIQIHLQKLLHIFLIIHLFILLLWFLCKIVVVKFMCSCTSTMTITGQQHEMVTSTTRRQSDLHKLLSVEEVICPIQQCKMNTPSEKLILVCTHHLIFAGEYIWALHLTSWPSCALHLKTWPNSIICFEWALIDDIDQQRLHLLPLTVLWGGISDSLSRYFIWKFELNFEIYSCFKEVCSTKDQ